MDGAKALAPALVALPRLSHVSLNQCNAISENELGH